MAGVPRVQQVQRVSTVEFMREAMVMREGDRETGRDRWGLLTPSSDEGTYRFVAFS